MNLRFTVSDFHPYSSKVIVVVVVLKGSMFLEAQWGGLHLPAAVHLVKLLGCFSHCCFIALLHKITR